MGIETEYGISVPGEPHANPMLLSGLVVNTYAGVQGRRPSRATWDYADEAPLRDARGFDLNRSFADPSQLTDVEDPAFANVVLTNGARLYVDHAHPEYSSPEVYSPIDALTWDRAGEEVMLEAVRRITALHERQGAPPVNLYKNNTDGKGQSYGTHENYLMRRETPFGEIVKHLTPFFVARQVITGAGRVGIGQDGSKPGFQLSQRSDFFEVEVGLETTLKRPIINTRDEPHAVADLYRRLHVIIGDANTFDVATVLKMGMTSIVLAMIEDGVLPDDLSIARPVAELHAVSHDPTLAHLVTLRSGRAMTALDLMTAYYERARSYADLRGGIDDETSMVLGLWESVLHRLSTDPALCAADLDWVAKHQLLQGYRDRDGLDWWDARLAAIDIQWSDVRPEKGLSQRLRERGRVTTLVDGPTVKSAVTDPPTDTRAYFRGRCLAQYADQIAAASWDSVIFDVPGAATLARVPMPDPHRGTRELVGEVLATSADVATMLARLTDETA